MREEIVGQAWYSKLKPWFESYSWAALKSLLIAEYDKGCYPAVSDIFNAYKLTDPDKIKAVIIGQDPYHNGHAHGLAFSSLSSTTPASLRTIFKEIDRDILHTSNLEEFRSHFPTNDLTSWAKQGVFLINPILTVRPGQPLSHEKLGWQEFTSASLQVLYDSPQPKVWLVWGKKAELTVDSIDRFKSPQHQPGHLFLISGHPATASYGRDTFSHNHHFSKTNAFLVANNQEPIQWSLKNS